MSGSLVSTHELLSNGLSVIATPVTLHERMADIGVLELLGGVHNIVRVARRTRGLPASDTISVDIGKGAAIRTRAVDSLAARVGCSTSDLFALIGIEKRTALRRRRARKLTLLESDRLYRLARVIRVAELTFGSEEKAHSWLNAPSPAFGMLVPLALLRTDAGAERVTEELNRIEWGDLY